jgi:hypothetical protein
MRTSIPQLLVVGPTTALTDRRKSHDGHGRSTGKPELTGTGKKKIKTDMQDYRIQYHRLLETIPSPVILVEKKKNGVKSWVST